MKWSIKGYKLPTPSRMLMIGRAARRFFAALSVSMFLSTSYPMAAAACFFAGEFVDFILNCFSEDNCNG